MSKHNVHGYCKAMHDTLTMTDIELVDTYGIEIDEDGSVWDPCENKQFASLDHWARHMQEQEEADLAMASSLKTKYSRERYEDDY